MSSANLESVTAALQNARVSPSGVSFAGKSLKLDSEEDGIFQNATVSIDYYNISF